MTDDRFLTEVARQQKYLDKLPEDFVFPLFNSKQALESQRRSGYRNTAAAAREIVDNALEAGATKINIAFERPKQLKAYQRQDTITSVAFIDNGSGMLPLMARYALSWGAGTHFDDPAFIGKFGFGLPNASINQTELVEVYTKTAEAKAVTKAWLDIREFQQHGIQTIPEPVEAELPEFVTSYIERHGLSFEQGTVVVWRNPDRLSYRTGATLKEHLVDDFGVTYRYLLDDVALVVESVQVKPVDPLFLDPKGRFYLPTEEGGAELTKEIDIAVKYFRDKETGTVHLKAVDDPAEIDENDIDMLATGAIHVRVARFPKGFAEWAGKKKIETDAHRRFEIRKSRRGMSFVRAKREIETVDVFPKTSREESKGLGDWPMLQSYAYHWGVEVRFDPSLDEAFGITNDKQTVRPIEDMWRVLVDRKVDEVLRAENAHQQTIRRKVTDPKPKPSDSPSAAESAAAGADSVSGKKPGIPDHDKDEAARQFEDAARRRAGVTKESIGKAKEAIAAEAKRRPYKIDYFEDPRAPFFEPAREQGSQIVARINKAHPFYSVFYARLLQPKADPRAKEAVDLLLLALAKGELTVEDETAKDWYSAQRERHWSPFLNDGLKILERTMQAGEEEGAEAEAREVSEPANDEEGEREPAATAAE